MKAPGLLPSDKNGEVAAAAHQAREILRKANLTWNDVIVGDDTEARASLVDVDRRLKRLSPHDQQLFIEVRARYFDSGCIDVSDARRNQYLKDLLEQTNDDFVPF